MQYEFRKADITDRDWVWSLFKELLKPSIHAQWGWDEAFQVDSFDKHLPINQFKIIQNEKGQSGAFCVVENDDRLHLKMLLISTEFQTMGLGKLVVEHVKTLARKHKLSVVLGVIKTNPVTGFYTKLGISILGEENGSYKLKWSPNV